MSKLTLPRYRSPLAIYVYWRDGYASGAEIATAIYRTLCRDPEEPESRGLGIVVRFRATVGIADEPQVARIIRVVIVDATMVDDTAWAAEVARILARSTDPGSVIPVQVSDAPMRELNESLAGLNAISLKHVLRSEWNDEIVRRLQHEVVRALVARARSGLSPAPVRLFVSHAKRDGHVLAQRIKEYVLRTTELHTFFDANDIAPGHKFKLEIFKSIEQSALVILRTDAYASREWCRREVIEAKRLSRPIVVVDALTKREERGFPYLGNVPAMRWDASVNDDVMCREILDLAVYEVLRCTYAIEQWLALQPLLVADSATRIHPIPRPPELLLPATPEDGERAGLLVYPDPPVGDEEAEVLVAHRSEVSAVTPLMLAWGGAVRTPLRGQNAAVSVSEPEDEDLVHRGLAREHLHEIAIELARYLLASGARLRYGGLRDAGFTEKLVTLVERHNAASGEPFDRIENFLAWPLHLTAGPRTREGGCKEVRVDRPADLDLAGRAPDAFVLARCFTAMREAICDGLAVSVVVGGRLSGYAGRIPGVIEEAALALTRGVPLFIVGGFGGAAGLVAGVVLGNPVDNAVAQLESSPDKDSLEEAYAAIGNLNEGSPFTTLSAFAGIPTSTFRNGLSEDENRSLMTTIHVPEILTLIIRGLRSVYLTLPQS